MRTNTFNIGYSALYLIALILEKTAVLNANCAFQSHS